MTISAKIIEAALGDAQAALSRLQNDARCLNSIEKAGQLLVEAFRSGKRVFSCGNGGSMCDAMHFAEELTGRFRRERKALPALAISDPAHLTCAGNDFGYERVFSSYINAHGSNGDVLLAISTSGKSSNILRAIEAARTANMKIIALCGMTGTPIAPISDICVEVGESNYSDRVQELHIKIIHILIELVERALFPENYQQINKMV